MILHANCSVCVLMSSQEPAMHLFLEARVAAYRKITRNSINIREIVHQLFCWQLRPMYSF